MIGKVVAHFEITGELGHGGMGSVYKARDQHLDRPVAVKVLLPEMVNDPDRRRRFVQEAKAASALNHPNIVHIYDIDEADGVLYIAMEYVAGKPLSELIPKKGLPLREALRYAGQVVDAMAAAHAAGIVHRDLKPSNIMITEQGSVKLLDFGLAKLMERGTSESDATATLAIDLTAEGTVVGTAAFMSPEQAEGKPLDERSDIFSFGAVLYEMITGQRAFSGTTRLSTLSSVLRDEPKPPREIRAEVPEELGRIIARCLRKEPGRRFQHMSDLGVALEEVKEESESGQKAVAAPGRKGLRWGLIAASAIVLVAAGAAAWRFGWLTPGGSPSGTGLAQAVQLTTSPGLSMGASLGPDGASMAFSSNRSGRFEVYVRQTSPRGTERQITSDGQQNIEPNWSPDGKTIVYHSVARHGIWAISAAGSETPRQLAPFGSRPVWSPDGKQIAFRSASPNDLAWFDWGSGGDSTIFTVGADGSNLRQITTAGNPRGRHADPSWSTDGKRVVFAAYGLMGARSSTNTLWTVEAASGELKQIATGNLVNQVNPVMSPDGRTIYFGALAMDGFGVYAVNVTGNAPAVELIKTGKEIPGSIAISHDGKRLFFSRVRNISQIWQTGEGGSPAKALYQDEVLRAKLPAYSPDGKHLAYVVQPQNNTQDVWMMNADGSNATPVVSDQGFANGPGWTSDSAAIWFTFVTTDTFQIRKFQPSDGSQQVLYESKENQTRSHLTPDQKELIYDTGRPLNVWARPVDGGPARQLTFDKEGASFPVISPDGQWIAYELTRGDGTTISVMERSGQQQQTILDGPGANYPFSFASDNRRIAYTACPDGVWNVFWIDRITKETKQVTNYTTYGSVVRAPAWRLGTEQMAFEYTEVKGNVYSIEVGGVSR